MMPRRANEQAFALALVVIINWVLAHLMTDWAMPPEVQSSLQSIITITIGFFLDRAARNGGAATIPTVTTPPPPSATPQTIGT